MISRMILPNFIVSHFIPPKACQECGRSDLSFAVLAPRFRWRGDWIELIYPLRCPCGGTGQIPIRLPTLLFGYILANVAIIDAAKMQRSKAMMAVSASMKSDVLEVIVRRFSELMRFCTCCHQIPGASCSRIDGFGGQSIDEMERLKFGFDEASWKQFLRRLGLDDDEPDAGSNGFDRN